MCQKFFSLGKQKRFKENHLKIVKIYLKTVMNNLKRVVTTSTQTCQTIHRSIVQ